MKLPGGQSARRSQLRVVALVGVAGCASLLCLFGRDSRATRDSRDTERELSAPPVASPSLAAAVRAALLSPPTPSLTSVARNEPQPSAAPELDGHPHPITAQHVKIQRELQLIQQLNDALDLRDARQLRSLIAEYSSEYPDDPNALRAGYERIADCLEVPGERTRDAGRDYYDRERASTLRRYVRRVCLE